MSEMPYLDPVAIRLGPIAVHWYGLILGLGALAGLMLAIYRSKRLGFNHELFLDLMLWGVPISIIGARAYYVIFQWEYYQQNPGKIVAIWEGGIAIHGALIGAIATAVVFCRVKKVPFWKLADIAAPSLLLGQAIGRWGNFMNQEAHGGPVDREFLESLHLPHWLIEQMNIDGVYYHPTFLYESLWNFLGVLVLLGISRLNLRRGIVFLSYFIWYSVGRFFVEGLRTDSLAFDGPLWLQHFLEALWSPMSLLFEPGIMYYGNIRVAQLVSVLSVLGAALLILYRLFWSRDKALLRDVDPQQGANTHAQEA